MLSKAKWFKTYGVNEDRFDDCKEIIQDGNDTSLAVIAVANSLMILAYTAINYIRDWTLDYAFIFALVEIIITVLYFLLSKVTVGYHHWFFYTSVFVLLGFGAYAMSFDNLSTVFLYPAIVVLLPLFYMHNMYANMIFYGLNYLIFILLAYYGPVFCRYMINYIAIVGFFTVVGMIIHYVYQSNRLREIINYRDSIEKRGALEITSSFDQLSKLLRRRSFVRLAEYQISNMNDQQFMILGIIDIDHFKFINDTYGHQIGDETISVIGRALSEELDVELVSPDEAVGFEIDYEHDYGNIVGRLGGDEFVFLIKSVVDIDDGIKLMKHLLDRLNRTSFGEISMIQGSIGIAPVTANDTSFDALYHRADIALYAAKDGGRNRCVIYDEELAIDKSSDGIDSLTLLLDRNSFKNKASKKIDESSTELALVHFDIENFKSYNAKYGFDKGDELLLSVAGALERIFKDSLLSRFSGDHFVVLTDNTEINERVIDVKGLVSTNQSEYANNLRVGVYIIERDKECDINLACDNAKMACDVLRGRYDKLLQYYDEKIEKQRDKFTYVVEHIDEAMDNGDIKVFFQPIIDISTRKAHSLEALARWDSREYGMLPPFDFINTLEKTRLIHKLDRYMVKKVCEGYVEAKKNANRDFVPVSINLSQRDFEIVDDIVDMVDDEVAKCNMPRYLLHLEITESALTEQKDHLKNVSRKFEELGYQIWMDDFGSGYSSLNVLKDFRFDVIKFDMAFLRGNVVSSKIILKHMIDMCKDLGLKTLIEGVETEDQFEFVKSLGCDYCQGYLFSKPVPFEGIVEYLENEK